MRLILPSAGFGTRMNMPIDQSKELLLYNGKPLIEFSLGLAKYFNLRPLVITRKEKTDLIQYCDEKNIDIEIITPEGEWANTVLMSEPFWEKDNILVLPDTFFTDVNWVFNNIINDLQIGQVSASFAVHKVEDSSKWGVIKDDRLYEKPDFTDPGLAWGIIGFKKDYGKVLFENCQKGKFIELTNYNIVKLESFEDLTRNGKNYLDSKNKE